MRTKLIASAFALLLSLGLVACGGESAEVEGEGGLEGGTEQDDGGGLEGEGELEGEGGGGLEGESDMEGGDSESQDSEESSSS